MKRIIYILILLLGLSVLFSFSLEQNTRKFPNENWWVYKNNGEGKFINKKRFFGKKEAFKFYEDHTLIALVKSSYCGVKPYSYIKMKGDWNYLNDSTLELYYGRESLNTYYTKTVKVKWNKDNSMILKTIQSDLSLYPRSPKPFLD